MKYKLLSSDDMKSIDALKSYHGGEKGISAEIENMQKIDMRKKKLTEKGFGEMIADAEKLVKQFPKVSDFEKKNAISFNNKYGIGKSQVSGFQGAAVTHRCMQRMTESASTSEPCYVPAEMISVVALTDNYIYNGDLLATLTMCENIMKTSKFCNTNLIGIPQPDSRFKELEKITGKQFDTESLGNGLSAVKLKNQGTAFGNLGGVEMANDNHLIYLDGITRTAKANGADFFLNPSWSSIIAACYFARDIKNLQFKVSMLLSTQNTMQFRMLLNIMSEYLREDGTTPIYEINIGNGTMAETFIQCSRDLQQSGIKGVSLAAHIFINPDLGREDFNWTKEMYKVLESGTNMTYKYESDGNRRDLDTMMAYFMPEEERALHAKEIGDVIYYKCLKASQDGRDMMRKGIKATFGESSYE